MTHRFPALTPHVADAAFLLSHPNANRLFIDVRLGEPADELRSFREQHIHGAVHAQIREVFASRPGALSGNLPLPDVARLQEQLRAWGVDSETEIVVSGPSPALAARGWWTLRWAGLHKVQVLDGGMREWIAQGGAVAQGDALPRLPQQGQPVTLSAGHMPQIEVEALEREARQHRLVDARDEASFDQGHLPLALNLAAAQQWTPSGRLRTVEEVRERYGALGVQAGDEVVVYCGGGVLSALSVLLLEALGVRTRLYVGSWSEWARSPQRIAQSLQAAGASA